MPRINQRYILAPCSGRSDLNIERGHVYRIYDTENGKNRSEYKNLGTMTAEEATKKFGAENVFFSQSDSLCDLCFKVIMGHLPNHSK